MRRPPDKDAQPARSERDVESSNATLNTLFGGSRQQKSWMCVAPGASVRPTPRTHSSSRLPEPPVVGAQKRGPTADVRPASAPSDEPSPVLVSSPMYGPRNETRSIVQNEGSRGDAIATLTPTPAPHALGCEGDSGPQRLRVHTAVPRPSSSSSSSFNQSPDQSRRPLATSPLAGEKSTRENPPLPSSAFLPLEMGAQRAPEALPSPAEDTRFRSHVPTAGGPSLLSPHMFSLSGLDITSRSASTPRQQASASNHHPMQASNFAPSWIQTNATVGVADSHSSPLQSSHPSPNLPIAPNPYKRQRTQAPEMSPLKSQVMLIEKHIESVGGMRNLSAALERPRFQLLVAACNNEDIFYVALHQIFCAWDLEQEVVMSIPGFPSNSRMGKAFRILGQLIRENKELTPTHRVWFSTFPSPFHDLWSSSNLYRNAVTDVGVFLDRLADNWQPLSVECSRRKYPPLVDELVDKLGLLSSTLQSVVFTAIRRNLGIGEEDNGTRMEGLFRRDRQENQALAARYNTARPPTAQEAQDRNANLVNEYLALCNPSLQRCASSTVGGSPVIRTSSPVLPSMSRAQPVANVAAWHQNLPNSHSNGHSQFVSQHQQRPPRAPSNSSNQPAMVGPPPSVGPHPSHQNIPSPTLLQAPSMPYAAHTGFQSPSVPSSNSPMQLSMQPAYSMASDNRSLPQPTITHQQAQVAYQHQQTLQQQQQRVFRPPQQNVAYYHPQQYQPAPHNALHVAQLPPPQPHQSMRQQQQSQVRQQVPDVNRVAQIRETSNRSLGPYHPYVEENSVGSNGNHNPTIHHIGRPSMSASHTLPLGRAVSDKVVAYHQKHPMARSLIPPLHYVHPPRPTVPEVMALHQAHLRSPRLVAADDPSSVFAADHPSSRFYQAIRELAIEPTRIPAHTPLLKLEFRIPEDQRAQIPEDIGRNDGQVASRPYKRGTLQYRLRCVQVKRTNFKCPITDWVLLDTIWPESASLSINKKQLELRRKHHHGKDLPIDITAYVGNSEPDGINRISLSIIRGRSKLKEFAYLLAVEVVEILQHDQIVEMVGNNRIPADVTLDKIKSSLAGPVDDDDDDIAMVVSDLSIDLADPFTARIFDTPVRGSNCLHRECFDLETFLLTRNSKAKRPEQPCTVDAWKCPLCGNDARPYSLIIDDFLVSVRQTLDAQEKLDVKAIWVGADGKWRPKIEKRKGMRDPNDSDFSDNEGGGDQADAPMTSNLPPADHVVISLDDD